MRSLFIAAVIFNVFKYFPMKLEKHIFLNWECLHEVYQLATVSFR